MAIVKKISDNDFMNFERELLSVLKNDPNHKIEFGKDKKMTVLSSRLKCSIIVSDVHIDEKTGNVVLVGAFGSGQPVMDETVRYPKIKEYISIPFKEVFNDLRKTSGLEDMLIDKTREAILDKYITPMLNLLQTRYLFDDNRSELKEFGIDCFVQPTKENHAVLDLTKLGMGHFLLPNEEILAVTRNKEGKDFILLKGDTPENNYHMLISRLGLKDMQLFGSQLASIQAKISEGMKAFTKKMNELQPKSMTRTEKENKEHQEAALMAIYETGLPLALCNSVARMMADSDIFDEKVHRKKDIIFKAKAYHKRMTNPEKGIKTSYVNSL